MGVYLGLFLGSNWKTSGDSTPDHVLTKVASW